MTPQTAQQINTPQVGRVETVSGESPAAAYQLAAQVTKLKSQLAAANAACAEMRERVIEAWNSTVNVDGCFTVDFQKMLNLATSATATDCGSDFVPKAELDRLKAVNAEMREAIETLMGPCRDQIDCYLHRQFPATVGHVPLREYFNRLFASANTDCGKDYVSKEQVKPLVETLRFIHDECDWKEYDSDGDNRIGEACSKALAHAKQLGIEP